MPTRAHAADVESHTRIPLECASSVHTPGGSSSHPTDPTGAPRPRRPDLPWGRTCQLAQPDALSGRDAPFSVQEAQVGKCVP